MKKVVILIVLVLILAGAGGAGWWFFLREAPEGEVAATEEAPAETVDGRRAYDLDPFVLPILRQGQVTEHLTLVLTMEFTKPRTKDEFKEVVPRLRDSLFSELHGILAFRHVYERDRVLPLVGDRLKKAGNEVLGQGVLSGVLIKGVSSRIPGET